MSRRPVIRTRRKNRSRLLPRFESLEERLPFAAVAFEIPNVPDFDQLRTDSLYYGGILGLPGDGGMYCAPTSSVNWAAFIASHGYPEMAPGENFWQAGPPDHPDIYNEATEAIRQMGKLMGTSATEGTNGAGEVAGTQTWLDTYVPGSFVASSYGVTPDFTPSVATAANLTALGDLVNASVGWYRPNRFGDYNRDGGHVFSVVKIAIADVNDPESNRQIGIRDPAINSGSYTTQSDFTTDTFAAVTKSLAFTDNGFTVNRELDELVGRAGGNIVAALDGLLAIKPVYGVSVESDSITVLYPHLLDHIDRPVEVHLPLNGVAMDLAIDPVGSEHVYVAERSNIVWKIDALTGESKAFAELPSDDLRHVVFGGARVFVASDTEIFGLGQDGRMQTRSELAEPVDAVAYDASRELFVTYCARCNTLRWYDRALQPVGAATLRGEPAERGHFRLEAARDGTLWLHQDGLAEVQRIQLREDGSVAASSLTLPGVRNPQGFSVDDFGNLFVSENGQLQVFTKEGRPNEDSRFNGLAGGSATRILRSVQWQHDFADSRLYHHVLPQDVGEERAQVMLREGRLTILGTSHDDSIQVTDHGDGHVEIIVAGRTREYSGVEAIVVQAEGGDDSVVVEGRFENREAADVEVDLGDGDDNLRMNVEDGRTTDRAGEAATQYVVAGGEGGDTVEVTANGRAANVGGSNRITISGEGGADTIRVTAQAPANGSTTDVTVDGGNGNDDIHVKASGALKDPATTIDVDGGDGSDSISLVTALDAIIGSESETPRPGSLSVHGGRDPDSITVTIHINDARGVDPEPFEPIAVAVAGGEGDDDISVFTEIQAKLGIEPEPFEPLRVEVRGNDGDDRIQIVNEFRSAAETEGRSRLINASYDVDGGKGDDTILVNSDYQGLAGDEAPVDDAARGKRDACDPPQLRVQGGRGQDLIAVALQGVLHGSLAVELLGGRGDDSITFDSHMHVATRGRFGLQVAGGRGDDEVSMGLIGRVDGEVDAAVFGGRGNDDLSAMLEIDTESTGHIRFDLLGGRGDDLLTLLAYDRRRTGFAYKLDGGKGNDECEATPNVQTTNCEGQQS